MAGSLMMMSSVPLHWDPVQFQKQIQPFIFQIIVALYQLLPVFYLSLRLMWSFSQTAFCANGILEHTCRIVCFCVSVCVRLSVSKGISAQVCQNVFLCVCVCVCMNVGVFFASMHQCVRLLVIRMPAFLCVITDLYCTLQQHIVCSIIIILFLRLFCRVHLWDHLTTIVSVWWASSCLRLLLTIGRRWVCVCGAGL